MHALHQRPVAQALSRGDEDGGVLQLHNVGLGCRCENGHNLGLEGDVRQQGGREVLAVEGEAERQHQRVLEACRPLQRHLFCDDLHRVLSVFLRQQHVERDVCRHHQRVHAQHVRIGARVDAVAGVQVGVHPLLVAQDDDGVVLLQRDLLHLGGVEGVAMQVVQRHPLQPACDAAQERVAQPGRRRIRAILLFVLRQVLVEQRDLGPLWHGSETLVHLHDGACHKVILRPADDEYLDLFRLSDLLVLRRADHGELQPVLIHAVRHHGQRQSRVFISAILHRGFIIFIHAPAAGVNVGQDFTDYPWDEIRAGRPASSIPRARLA
mmetsp:Transcript_3567/g.9093  ORF Transcript_3567/g.9093 Transcript_3567/m.9093 type:complete len:323 (+) Transcript_3567:976-1944(+)